MPAGGVAFGRDGQPVDARDAESGMSDQEREMEGSQDGVGQDGGVAWFRNVWDVWVRGTVVGGSFRGGLPGAGDLQVWGKERGGD